MANIEITTAHNVVLQYPLATVFDRGLAFFIDLVVMGISYVILLGVLNAFFDIGDVGSALLGIPFTFYTFLSELIMHGQTIGKKGVGIRVVKINGNEPDVSEYFQRWTFRLLEIILTSGSLAAILIATSKRRQRLGGLISDTAVIKVKNYQPFQLKDIVKLSENSSAKIVYANANVFSEDQIVLVKRLLIRKSKYGAQYYNDLVIELAAKMSQQIEAKIRKGQSEAFLRQIIKDYVILTR